MKTAQVREFRRCLRRFERVTNTQLRDCCAEVSLAQCLVLLEVDEMERVTVGQLAEQLRLDNSTLSRTIDGLVRKGLLDRVRDDRDRRVVWVSLTEEGGSTCEAIHAQNDALYRGVFEKIAPSRREAVLRNFNILVRAFLDHETESDAEEDCASAVPAEAAREPR